MKNDEDKSQLSVDYSASAAAYEVHWGPVLAMLAEAFVRQLPISGAGRILDVGAGTGRMVRHLQSVTDAVVYGVDRSMGMLQRGPADALLARMDAEQLGFASEVFNTALAMFMLFHLRDPAAGLSEIRRVLKPKGVVAFTTWGKDDSDFRAFEVFEEVLDRHGAAEGRSFFSRHDLTDSVEGCSELLGSAGFTVFSVRAERMAHTWTVEHLLGFRTQVGYGRTRWESLDPGKRPEVMEEGRRALEALPPDALIYRDEVIYTVGIAT